MIVHITRFVLVTAGAMGGFTVSRLVDWSDTTGLPEYYVILILILLGSSMGYVAGGIFGRELKLIYERAEERLSEMAPVDFTLGATGMIVGLLIALLASWPLRLLEPSWIAVLTTVALFMMGGYLGLRIALLKRDDIASSFPKLAGPEAEARAGSAARAAKLLDTSAIIDGRFTELVALGLLEGPLKVPRFVLSELQTLADSADDVKRSRGRRGLDLLTRLSASDIDIQTFEADYPTIPETDGKLMRLAEDMGASIVTVDYNLTKVARLRDVNAINLNEVATALKPAFLPGEAIRLEVQKAGKEDGQGVGYLDDGTMVVIQDGRGHIGERVDAEVTSVLQTSAGRMIFARFTGEAETVDSDE